MTSHDVGTRDEWVVASAALLEREKELTTMGDELARERRELPWVQVEKRYQFQTASGPKFLSGAVWPLFAACDLSLHVRALLLGRLPNKLIHRRQPQWIASPP